jgi:hypothetical protein
LFKLCDPALLPACNGAISAKHHGGENEADGEDGKAGH